MNRPSKKNEIIERKILDFLENAKTPQSRVAILCAVYGFRNASGIVLSWSVLERQLLQQRKFEEAEKLLKTVTKECEKKGLQKNVVRASENQSRFELVNVNPIQQKNHYPEYVRTAIKSAVEQLSNKLSIAESDLGQRVQVYVDKWTWRIWRRHSIERHCKELIDVINEKNEAQVNITRAIKSLEEDKKIKVEGTRKQMLISLLKSN